MSKVRIELNHEGIRALLRSSEMMSVVQGIAEDAQGRLGEGYEVSTHTGPGRVNASITAETPEARQQNLDANSLLKALK